MEGKFVEGVEVDWLNGLKEELAKDWADLEWRRELGFGERGLWGYKEEGDGGMEDVEDDAYDEAEEVSEGGLRRDQKADRRCFFVSVFGTGFGKLDVVEAVEDEEDEKAIEKRDGEPGRPILITLPFEAIESGLV